KLFRIDCVFHHAVFMVFEDPVCLFDLGKWACVGDSGTDQVWHPVCPPGSVPESLCICMRLPLRISRSDFSRTYPGAEVSVVLRTWLPARSLHWDVPVSMPSQRCWCLLPPL